MGWVEKYKGAGPAGFNFTEQPDKWGYQNNPRWTVKPNTEKTHTPCGHWHKIKEIPFHVGRLLGWDSIYNHPWGYGWDKDYARLVKIDLTTLNAIDYSTTIDPDFGRDIWDYNSYKGFAYQLIDACDTYVYLIFTHNSNPNYKIYKIDTKFMTIVQYGEFPHNGFSQIVGGCADMQWIYLIHYSDKITMIPTDLNSLIYTTFHRIPPVQGQYMGAQPIGSRGIKVDPYEDVLYYCGNFGTSKIKIKDLTQIGHYEKDTYGTVFGGHTWSSNLLWNRRVGRGYTHISYHPFNPRCYTWPATPPEEYHTEDACVGMADWNNSAFYQCGCNFYGYVPYAHHWINRIEFSGSVTARWKIQTFDGINPPLPGNDLVCNKKGNKIILKSIENYGGIYGSLGTYLSRWGAWLELEEYRKNVKGFKSTLMSEEPQIWTMD